MNTATDIRIADEVFIATALLHREHPDRDDFTLTEIVERVEKENLSGELRPGLRVHASVHCVANRPPNPGRYAMLYATGGNTRRLVRAEDHVHPGRTGKVFPQPEHVPAQYHDLIEWAKDRYGKNGPGNGGGPWLEGALKLFGTGRELWKDEEPDEYVRKLREGWD